MATINITPNGSGEGLSQELSDVAESLGATQRRLVAAIYEYAVDHQSEFTGTLKSVKRGKGEHIGTVVTDDVAKSLNAWAKARQVPRGVHCKYLLEKALELKIAEKILSPKAN